MAKSCFVSLHYLADGVYVEFVRRRNFAHCFHRLKSGPDPPPPTLSTAPQFPHFVVGPGSWVEQFVYWSEVPF